MSTPTAFSYYGGKARLAPIIQEYMPPGSMMKTYVEPFCGSAALLFSCPHEFWADIEVLNDISGDIVNFFRVLRDQPLPLIEKLQMTPFSRREINESDKMIAGSDDPIMKALYFFVRVNQSFSNVNRANSWAVPVMHNKAGEWIADTAPEKLFKVAERLRHVALENNPALKIMKLYDHPQTLMYLDPPYLSVNDSRVMYASYQGKGMDENQHHELVEKCLSMKSMMIISGYDHSIYDSLEQAGWQKVKIPTYTTISNNKSTKGKNVDQSRTEILWVSPNLAEINRHKPIQLNFQIFIER